MLTVRGATPGDAGIVTALLSASYGEMFRGWYDDAELAAFLPLITRANPALLASGRYFIAGIDGVPAGCGGWSSAEPGTGKIEAGVGHVRHFATDPRFLRKGVAGALLSRCLAEAQAEGVNRMMCLSSLQAVDFYRRFGFEPLRDKTVVLPGGIAMRSMEMERRN